MAYIPERFDIIYLDMGPQSGTEITKRRSYFVLSTANFNLHSSKAFVCPITSSSPRSATHLIYKGNKIQRTILVDQMRSLDWKSRRAERIEQLNDIPMCTTIIEIVNTIIIGEE